jgi:hypothetical protein
VKTTEGSSQAWFAEHGSTVAQAVAIATLAGLLWWIVAIYADGLRDPRHVDGWIMAAGIGAQIWFHLGRKTGSRSPRSAARWRRFHVFLGYLLILVFLSHSKFSLPDSAFEWGLWTSFVLVAASGVFGAYLSWFLQARLTTDERTTAERIPARRAELAREVRAAVTATDPKSAAIPLPSLPHDEWIRDFHTTRLRDFFAGHRNVAAHLVGSRRPLKHLMTEMDNLATYLDRTGENKLAYIRTLVIEKDQLDVLATYHALTRGWLLVHVPATYALVVLVVLHVLVVHAFSAGAW